MDYAGYCFSKITSYFLVCDSNRIFLSIFKSVCISWEFFIHSHLDFLFLGSLQCSVWVLVIGAPVRTSVNSRACSLPTSARQNRFEHVTPVHRLSLLQHQAPGQPGRKSPSSGLPLSRPTPNQSRANHLQLPKSPILPLVLGLPLKPLRLWNAGGQCSPYSSPSHPSGSSEALPHGTVAYITYSSPTSARL